MKNKYEFETEVYLKVSQHKMRNRKRAAAFTALSLVAVLTFSGVDVLLRNRIHGVSDETVYEPPNFSIEKTDVAYSSAECASLTDCTDETTSADTPETDHSAYRAVLISYDYPSYSTVAEVAEAATDIYIGTVTGISFEIIDMNVGDAYSTTDSANTSRMLYTVYTVQPSASFKGGNTDEIKIYQIGGMIGYEEALQYSMIEKSGLSDKYHGIPVAAGTVTNKLTIGARYLFCTIQTAKDHNVPINPAQFAYDAPSAYADEIIAHINKS